MRGRIGAAAIRNALILGPIGGLLGAVISVVFARLSGDLYGLGPTFGAWAVGGFLGGMGIGLFAALIVFVVAWRKPENRKLRLLHKKDARAIPLLLSDVARGGDFDALQAIGALPTYRDAGVSWRMLRAVQARIEGAVPTHDPAGLAKCAVQSILDSRHEEAIAYVRELALNDDGQLGIYSRRLTGISQASSLRKSER